MAERKGSYTTTELLQKVADYKRLKLWGDSHNSSEPIKEYVLDEKIIALLKTKKFEIQERTEPTS